jgi:hypothetical protein
MYLVLCMSSDASALWAYQGLAARGLAPVLLITEDMLSFSSSWVHRISDSGTDVSFRLPDGHQISSSVVQGVLNRFMAPSRALIGLAAPEDRDYAAQEITAFHLSWISSLKVPVINLPAPQGLAGPWLHASEWVAHANRAGLFTAPYRLTDEDSDQAGYASLVPAGTIATQVIVLDGDVYGAPIPAAVRQGCVALARQTGMRLIGVEFYPSDDDPWTFAHASPLPALQIGGAALLDGLVRSLGTGGVQ